MLQTSRVDKVKVLRKSMKVGSTTFINKNIGSHNRPNTFSLSINIIYFMSVVNPTILLPSNDVYLASQYKTLLKTDESCLVYLNLSLLKLERLIYYLRWSATISILVKYFRKQECITKLLQSKNRAVLYITQKLITRKYSFLFFLIILAFNSYKKMNNMSQANYAFDSIHDILSLIQSILILCFDESSFYHAMKLFCFP